MYVCLPLSVCAVMVRLAVCLWMLQEGLKQCRRIHDQGNQKEETELDLLLDQLRQGPNEEVVTLTILLFQSVPCDCHVTIHVITLPLVLQVLRTLLQESLTRLDHVRDSYHAFQQRMLSELAKYPVAVASTISNYDLKLCKYFQVERKPPKVKACLPGRQMCYMCRG